MSLKIERATLTPIINKKIKRGLFIKDIFHLSGYLTTGGAKPMMEHISSIDAEVISFLRGIWEPVSKDNLDEMAVGDEGFSTLGGKVKFLEKDLGGSSTGTALNTFFKKNYLGVGSDTGGSARDIVYNLPGLEGFKPTWGLISRFGMFQYCNPLDTVSLIGKRQNIFRGFVRSLKGSNKDSSIERSVLKYSVVKIKPKRIFFKNILPFCRLYYNLVSVYLWSNLQRFFNKNFNGSNWWFSPSKNIPYFGKTIRRRYLFGQCILNNQVIWNKSLRLWGYYKRLFEIIFFKYKFIETPVRDNSLINDTYLRNWGLIIANIAGCPSIAIGNKCITGYPGSDFSLLTQWK